MGQSNDKIEIATKTNQKKLYKIIFKKKESIFDLEENDSKGEFNLISYTLNNKIYEESNIQIPIFKNLYGITQFYYNNFIFLCGNNEEEKIISSNLISINLNKKINNSTVLINSYQHHFYPSLIITKELNLVVIGGKKEKSCEIYSIRTEKWKEIDNLPNERYQCSLCYDQRSDYLYLFGGFDSEKNIIHDNILRIYSKYFIQWEIINISEGWDSSLLKRNYSFCFNGIDIGHVYLFGGKNEENKCLNNLILFTFMKLKKRNSVNKDNKDIYEDNIKTIQNCIEEVDIDDKYKEIFSNSNFINNIDDNTFFYCIDDNLNFYTILNKDNELIPEITKHNKIENNNSKNINNNKDKNYNKNKYI